MTTGKTVTVGELAVEHRIDPKQLRHLLRASGRFPGHEHYERWIFGVGSPEHEAVLEVLRHRTMPADFAKEVPAPPSPRANRTSRDEEYVIDLCDQVLGLRAQRQRTFDFLRGDLTGRGRSVKLRVDAYYEPLALVIEYHEVQHSKPVALFDKATTATGVPRSEQRRQYDQRRRELLPLNGIELVEIASDMFQHRRGRLARLPGDIEIVRSRLTKYLHAEAGARADGNSVLLPLRA